MNHRSHEPFGLEQMQQIAEDILGSIDWHDTQGDLDHCPGHHLHTTPSKRADCKVFLDKVPTVHCFHSSCSVAVEEANHTLRSAIAKARWSARPPTREEKLAMHKKQMEKRKAVVAELILKRQAQSLKRRIFTDYAWSIEQAMADSPVTLPEDPGAHWRLILELFDPRETVWIGEKEDSGGRSGRQHFKSAGEWLTRERIPPGHFTCPAVFSSYCSRRSNDSVLYKRFWVIESDTLSKPDTLAVFRWCRQFMRLNAIVDTAGKSLHGWFDRLGLAPGTTPKQAAALYAQLKTFLIEFGCDRQMFVSSQPCRLPGAMRDGRYQRLLWFDRPAPLQDWGATAGGE